MKELTVTLKPYDYDIQDKVFSTLFCNVAVREDGLTEVPAASYQLVASALEYILWELSDPKDIETVKRARGIVEGLRDRQKCREWDRKRA